MLAIRNILWKAGITHGTHIIDIGGIIQAPVHGGDISK